MVVVDDASTDGTDKVLAALMDSSVRVVTHTENQGKGAAIRTALTYAQGDLVLIQDADLEYDPDDWPRLLDPVMKHKASVVYGSRFTGERKNMMILHWIGNRFLSLVTNVLYQSTLSDHQVEPLRLRARGHSQGPAAGVSHLRSADLLCRARAR